MRESFPTATRTEYLSGDVTPRVQATLRQLRLDFGAALYQKNDNGVIDGSLKAGDDYYDPLGHRVRWGDSCVSDISPFCKLLLIAESTWSTGDSDLWYARSTSVSDSWTIAALSPTGTGPGAMSNYTRPGIHPGGGTPDTTEIFYLWYLDSSDDLYRITLTHTISGDSWAWSSKTTGYNISAFAGAAIHPISASEAILVAYEDPYLWVKYCKWNGSDWTDSGSDWVVCMSDSLVWSDAHWSDAEPLGSDRVVVALNLSRWGSAYTAIYDKTSGLWSQPRELLPSAETWGNLRCWVSGLSTINGRVWAVTVREPVGSRDIPFATHAALCSSDNGLDWTDEGFVTKSCLRGKLLYRDTETYCYVAGNVSVARALATNKLGHDATALKHVINEAYGVSVTQSGPGSAPQLTLQAFYSASLLAALENADELVLEFGAVGQSYGTYCTTMPLIWTRTQQHDADLVQITAYGLLGRLMGEGAYRPIAARAYDGPYSLASKFQFDNGTARLTVRQESGTWVTTKYKGVYNYCLYCKKPGVSLVPHSMANPWLVARAAFCPKVSVEGIYFTFWHEDDENYWQAGVYNDSGTQKVVIDRYKDGAKTNKANAALTAALNVGSWYTMYLDTRPGKARIYIRRSDSYDYSSTTDSTSYDLTAESEAPPDSHHIGLKVEDFVDWEGAVYNGTVTGVGHNYLEDSAATFGTDVLGKWLRCNNQNIMIIDRPTTTQVVISPGWGDQPDVGEDYGIYPDESRYGPQCYFRELFVHEGIQPWTVDDIVNNIMALCMTNRSDAFTGTGVGALDSNSPMASDADIRLEAADASSTFYLWLSSTSTSGENIYSGLRILVESTFTSLITVENDGASGQTVTTVAKHPNMLTLPGATVSKALRLQACKNFITVSCDGHFVTAFPVYKRLPEGYIASSGSGTATEFPDMPEGFIWDANEPASAAMGRLLEGRRARVVERCDGSVSISRFEDELGNAGVYTTPVVQHVTERDLSQIVSLTEIVGAEERAFYLDAESARRGLRYMRGDNPTLETQGAALDEARRQARLGWQYYQAGGAALYITDPGVELEDRFQAVDDSNTYRVVAVNFRLIQDESGQPKAAAEIRGRLAPGAPNTGVYGTATYDGDTEYG